MASQVATFLATFSDRYFLQAWADETVVGLYNLAYQFGFLLVMVGFTPIFQVWGPKRFEVARGADAHRVLSRGFFMATLLLATTAMGISLYVDDVLRIMATSAFHSAGRVVPLLLIAYVLQSWSNLVDIGILVKEKTRYLALANWASAIVAVVGYAVLVPLYLEWGAAWATLASFATKFLLTYAFSQRLWRIEYEWRPIAWVVAWAAGIAVCGLELPTMGVLASLAARTGLVGAFAVGLWYLPILTPGDRDAVLGLVREGRARIRRGRA